MLFYQQFFDNGSFFSLWIFDSDNNGISVRLVGVSDKRQENYLEIYLGEMKVNEMKWFLIELNCMELLLLWVRVLNWTLANRMICVFWKISENMTFSCWFGRFADRLELTGRDWLLFAHLIYTLIQFFFTVSCSITALKHFVRTHYCFSVCTLVLCYVKNSILFI